MGWSIDTYLQEACMYVVNVYTIQFKYGLENGINISVIALAVSHENYTATIVPKLMPL